MSFQIIRNNTGNQLTIDTNVAKIFVWGNRYTEGSYTNDSYADVQLPAGTLMGRVAATQALVPLASNASDGSQYPVGILAEDIFVAEGAQQDISICVLGDVVEDMIGFAHAGDNMDTLVSGRSLRDRIGADTVGIKILKSTEQTATDN
ncbi:MAG TPA: head decoration protein [Bacteroidia bacterium]|nr:head decoration protein [Bacteroidia bacterium]